VTGIGPIKSPTLPEVSPGDGDIKRARSGHRRVYFEESWHHAGVYRREDLRAGDMVSGSAVVEEFGSTLPIAPGFAGRVDLRGNIILTKDGSEQ
jgi:N-methylhydantoinase A